MGFDWHVANHAVEGVEFSNQPWQVARHCLQHRRCHLMAPHVQLRRDPHHGEQFVIHIGVRSVVIVLIGRLSFLEPKSCTDGRRAARADGTWQPTWVVAEAAAAAHPFRNNLVGCIA